jgi:TolA-binding protein
MIAARHRLTARIAIAFALAGTALSAPALAQNDPEARIKRLEAEVRALQRKVFPGGDGKYFEPQIVAPAATTTVPAPTVATGPVNVLMGRIDAVEGALARVTAQNEENANRMAKLEARLAAFEANSPTTSATVADSPPAADGPASITGSVSSNVAAMTGTASRPSAERVALVAAVEKPASGDAGEDDYLYGYRLWEARYFPEAAQQLKLTVDKHPRHKRISYARNLLGRAYLDDGKPGMAAQVFLQNYQADKRGERAADSLLYLAVAMTRLKETQKACVALAEFADAYPAEAAGRLAGQYQAARNAVKCN